jgi:cell division septal protein FtsQ
MQFVSDWQVAPLWQKVLLVFIGLLLIVLFFKETFILKPYRKIREVRVQYQNLDQQIKTAKLLLNDEKVVAENLGKAQKLFTEQIPAKKDIGHHFFII